MCERDRTGAAVTRLSDVTGCLPGPRRIYLTPAQLDRLVGASGLAEACIAGDVTILGDYWAADPGCYCLAVIGRYDGGGGDALRLAAGLGATLAPFMVSAIIESARTEEFDSHHTLTYFPAASGPAD